MNPNDTLQKLGITENETKVYLALLESGPSLAGGISRKTGIHRRNVYDITERLIKKGLNGYIVKNGRRLFEAANPEKFSDIIDEKRNELSGVLPLMKELYAGTKEKQETNFYKGKEGLKTVFQDQLDENNCKEILILGASQMAESVLPFYFKWYDIDRKKKKIKVRIIASEKLKGAIPLSEIRYVPQKYANPLAINVYKDKVALILWKREPMAVVIKNKEVSDGYRKYFELMWLSGRK